MTFADAEWSESSPEDAGLDARRLDDAMDVVRRISGEQGTTRCAVVRHGRLVWRGPDVDRIETVWSCTKTFLGTVLGLLVDDGRCTLETLAADVHPPLAEHYPAMTLRHLATLTSGYRPREVSADVPPLEPGLPLFAPGEKFHYSWDPYLLALLLTKLAGESLRDVFRRRIAEPIGLEADAWQWGDWGPLDHLTGLRGVPVCGGSGLYGRGVRMSARAMVRAGWLFACDGAWNGRQLVSRQWIRDATRPQVPADMQPYDPQAWYAPLIGRYGYCWWTNGTDSSGRRLWPSTPERMFAMQGHLNNHCFVIPDWRTVVVRLGSDAVIDTARYDEFFAALRAAFLDVA